MNIQLEPNLEIWFGNEGDNVLIPLVDIGNGRFMIKTKDDHQQLADSLITWIPKNSWLRELQYKQYVEWRFGTCDIMLDETIKISYLCSSVKNDLLQNDKESNVNFINEELLHKSYCETQIIQNKNGTKPSKKNSLFYSNRWDNCSHSSGKQGGKTQEKEEKCDKQDSQSTIENLEKLKNDESDEEVNPITTKNLQNDGCDISREKDNPIPIKNLQNDGWDISRKYEKPFEWTTKNANDQATAWLNDWKAHFVKSKKKACRRLIKEIHTKGFSLWHCLYNKARTELTNEVESAKKLIPLFEAIKDSNEGFFAVHGLYGTEPNFNIKGIWLMRGKDMPEKFFMQSNDKKYKWRRMNLSKQKDLERLRKFCYNTDRKRKDHLVEGEVPRQVRIFK